MSVERMQALMAAPNTFSRNGERLTPIDRQVLDLTWESLTDYGQELFARRAFQPEGQAEGDPSHTFRHELAVGGLVLSATENPDAAVAAALHDTGKGRSRVRELISSPVAIMDMTEEERNTIRSHAAFGSEDLEGAIKDPALGELARFVAANHHTLYPAAPDPGERPFWEVTGMVRTGDISQAILLDWRRQYKAARMAREGLINQDGYPIMDAIMEVVIPESERGRSYMGVPVTAVVEAAVQHMPTPEFIRDRLEQIRRQAA